MYIILKVNNGLSIYSKIGQCSLHMLSCLLLRKLTDGAELSYKLAKKIDPTTQLIRCTILENYFNEIRSSPSRRWN